MESKTILKKGWIGFQRVAGIHLSLVLVGSVIYTALNRHFGKPVFVDIWTDLTATYAFFSLFLWPLSLLLGLGVYVVMRRRRDRDQLEEGA